MGVSFLANISGLQNVNGEMYEAGAIDGIRNRWQELWYNASFDATYAPVQRGYALHQPFRSQLPMDLAGYPSVNNSVDTIVSYLSDAGTVRYEMGYACTISVCCFYNADYQRLGYEAYS